MLFYSFSQLPLLDWQALSTLLAQRQIETQTQLSTLLLELYRRGLLTTYLDFRSLLAVGAGIGAIVSGSVGAIHLLVDKLFFRKFYLPPNYPLALRRALFWTVVALLIYALAVLNYLQLVVLFSVLIIALILEVVISGMGVKQVKTQPEGTTGPESGTGKSPHPGGQALPTRI